MDKARLDLAVNGEDCAEQQVQFSQVLEVVYCHRV